MSSHARDAALRRLQLLNRWAAVAAVILTVAFSVVVAHAFPGRSIAKTPLRRSPAPAHRRAHHRRQRFPNPFPSEDSSGAAPTTRTQSTPAAQTSTAPVAPAPVAPAPAPVAPAAAPAPAPSQPAPVVSGGS